MSDKDLGEELENLEGELDNLKNKEFKLFGIKMTPMTIGAAFAALSTVIGTLYGGFLMYQKVEQAIEFVDQQQEYEEKIAGFEGRMELIEQQVTAINENTTNIKTDLKGDIQRAEGTADDAYRYVKEVNKDVNDELRAFRKDMKELETTFENKLQKALDNPLAN
jgi:hypothetical protein